MPMWNPTRRSRSHWRTAKQRNPTKTQEVGRHCSCPLFWVARLSLVSVRSSISLIGHLCRRSEPALDRSVSRCVGIRGRKSSETNLLTGEKVHAGVFTYLRGTYEGKKSDRKLVFVDEKTIVSPCFVVFTVLDQKKRNAHTQKRCNVS